MEQQQQYGSNGSGSGGSNSEGKRERFSGAAQYRQGPLATGEYGSSVNNSQDNIDVDTDDRRAESEEASTSNAGGKRLSRPIIRGVQACTQCRTQKVRCVPPIAGPGDAAPPPPFPCLRCINQGITCEVLKHNRGRKRKAREGEEGYQSPPPKQAAYYTPDGSSASSLIAVEPREGSIHPIRRNSARKSQTNRGSASASEGSSGQTGSNLHILEQAIAIHGVDGDGNPRVQTGAQRWNDNSGRPDVANATPVYPLQPPSAVPSGPMSTTASQGPAISTGYARTSGIDDQAHTMSQHQANNTTYSIPPRYPQYYQPLHPQPPQTSQHYHSKSIPSILTTAWPSPNARDLAGGGVEALPYSATSTRPPVDTYGDTYRPLPSTQQLPPMPAPARTNDRNAPSQNPLHDVPPLTIAAHQTTYDAINLPQQGTSRSNTQHMQKSAGEQQYSRSQPTTAPNTASTASDHPNQLEAGREQRSSNSTTDDLYLNNLRFPFLHKPSISPHRGRKGMFSITSLAKTDDTEEIGPGSAHLKRDTAYLLANDPIDAGITSVEDAKSLFQLFVDEMGALNCILDPVVHTHDFVRARSSFLYLAILSTISRYLNSSTQHADGKPRRLVSPVYSYCKQAVQAHLKQILGDIVCDFEAVQGLAILAFHKDPEEEKACSHLYRAIAIAREIGLDTASFRQTSESTDEDCRWVRIQQRVWLSLFVANTILHMQFDMKQLIGPDEPAIAASTTWCRQSTLPMDWLLCTNIQLRRLYHIYSDMAKSLDREMETDNDKAAKLLSLSVLSRTANRQLENTAHDWRERCKEAGVTRLDAKISTWLSAIKLRFNLTIVQTVLPGLKEMAGWSSFLPASVGNDGPGDRLELGCIQSFHHAVTAACSLLQSMRLLEEKRLLSFSADTFLHFAIYSAFFLWTLCRDAEPGILEAAERKHCIGLIDTAAQALESASLFAGDSPALHARFLRNLLRTANDNSVTSAAYPTSSSQYGHLLPGRDMADSIAVSGSASSLNQSSVALAEPGPMPQTSLATFLPALNGIAQNSNPAAWQTSAVDTVLTADWSAMEKQFPWLNGAYGLGLLDATNPQNTAIEPTNMFMS